MIKLIWFGAAMTLRGVVPFEIEDSATFQTQKECTEYAEAMKGRAADWIRGATRSGWNFPVEIAGSCRSEERPA